MNTTADRDELVRFWSAESDWDKIDAQVWEHRFVNTPFGEAAFALAIDENTNAVVGQFVFIPTLVSINGHEIPAYRPFAPLLAKNARGFQSLNPLNHPIIKMYWLAIDYFQQNNVGLIYMMPDPRWLRWFQFVSIFQIGSFPLWSLKLPLAEMFVLPSSYSVKKIVASDVRLNKLWQKTAKFYNCSIVRNSKMLAWKTSHGNYFCQGIERGGEIVGFVALQYKERDRQLVICELLAADAESLRATLVSACNAANVFRLRNPDRPCDKAAILTTELLHPVVEHLGFYRDKYDFPMVIQTLDSSLAKEQVAPSRWQASAKD